jgi:hypothetical protein
MGAPSRLYMNIRNKTGITCTTVEASQNTWSIKKGHEIMRKQHMQHICKNNEVWKKPRGMLGW